MKDNRGRIGAILAEARVDSDQEPEDVSRASGLKTEFIHDLEAGAYERMAHDALTLASVKKYAYYVGIDPETSSRQYLEERGELPPAESLRRIHQQRTPIVTSSILWQLSVAAALLAIVVYIIFQLVTAMGEPNLSVVFPEENQVIYGEAIEIAGVADPESVVRIDGNSVFTDTDGSFRYEIEVSEGRHTLTVQARDDLGNTTEMSRTFIVAEEPMD